MATERDLQHQIKRTFEALGGRARKRNDLGHMLRALGKAKAGAAPSGEPDYTATLDGLAFYIEAKDSDSGSAGLRYSFKELTPEQRVFLHHYETYSYLWLWMGQRINSAEYPLRAWLIPWPKYYAVEVEFREAGLLSMAYLHPKELKHREQGLSAVNKLGSYELIWFGDGIWRIPPLHELWRRSAALHYREPERGLESEVHIRRVPSKLEEVHVG